MRSTGTRLSLALAASVAVAQAKTASPHRRIALEKLQANL